VTADTRARLLLAAIVAASVAIRIPGLLHDGLWRDEAYVYVDVIAPTFREFFHRLIETEYHPPLYFLLSYVWLHLAGTSELALKALPFLCSILTVPVVYRLGTTAGSRAVGLLAAAMYGVSPLAILEAGDYLYPLMTLLCTLLAGLVMAGRREALRPGRLVAVGVVTALAMYTHYAALFYVPMLVAWALTSPRGVRHGATLAAALLLGALPFLLWLPAFFSQSNPYLLKPAANPGTPLLIPPPNATAKLGFFAWTIVQSMPLWPEKLAIVLIALLLVALVMLLASRMFSADAMAMGSMYVLGLAVISAGGRLNVRYIAPFQGLLCVFLAWVVVAWFERFAHGLRPRPRRWAAAATATLGLFVLAEDTIFAAHTARLPKSGIRTFVASQPLDPASLYVIVPDYMTATFVFYARDPGVAYTAFAQVDHPEIFRYGEDASHYGPGAVRAAVVRLNGMARRYRYLDFIVEDSADKQKTLGGILYRTPARRLLDSIESRYTLVARAHYPGRLESVTVYRFRTEK